MDYLHAHKRRWAAALALAALWAPALTARAAAPHGHQQAAGTPACSALGTYQVGPRVLPTAGPVQGHQTAPGVPTHSSAPTAIAWPATVLRGKLVITAYSGCGSATQGTFEVSRSLLGPLPTVPPAQGKAIACAVPCWWSPSGIITATGRFSQDPAHPSDPTFVTVSATITTARPGPQMGRPCSVQSGCPPPSIITTTVAITGITGYLQATAGKIATTQGYTGTTQTATLSFLPPPLPGTGEIPAAMILQGWRSQGGPAPVPVPLPRR